MTVSFLGDTLIDELPGQDALNAVRSLVDGSDEVVCNLEGPIPGDAEPAPKIGPVIAQSTACTKALRQMAITACTLANNHIGDYGKPGIQHTIESLDASGLRWTGVSADGSEAFEPLLLGTGQDRVAVLAATEAQFGSRVYPDQSWGADWIGNPLLSRRIRKLKSQGICVIVAAHAGAEDVPFPLQEWRRCYRELIEAGADAVVGHHPHVPQHVEVTESGAPIFYSLGNSLFPRLPGVALMTPNQLGYAARIVSNNGTIHRWEIVPYALGQSGSHDIRRVDAAPFMRRLSALGEEAEKLSDEQVLFLFLKRYQGLLYAPFHRLVKSSRFGLVARMKIAFSALRGPEALSIRLRKETQQGDTRALPKDVMRWHLHNLQTETHRWAIARGAQLLSIDVTPDPTINRFTSFLDQWNSTEFWAVPQ